jgi:hypothetical protein
MAGQLGMMSGPMMNMMQMMGGGYASGMGMIDHVEGRISFLRTYTSACMAATSAATPPSSSMSR